MMKVMYRWFLFLKLKKKLVKKFNSSINNKVVINSYVSYALYSS